MDDTEWRDIQASCRGDGEAYRRLIERHQSAVAARMRRFTSDRRTLEELVHDVFVEAYFSLTSYSARAPFSHWLQRIATRVGYRYWKQRRRNARVSVLSPENDRAVDPKPEASDAESELGRVLEQLPPRDRLVITLLYLEERSVVETSELTGWSRTMVKVQAFRARRKLKSLLEARLEAVERVDHGRRD